MYRVIKATREELMARLGLEHPELMERIAIETRRRRRGNRPAAGKTEEEAASERVPPPSARDRRADPADP